MSKQTNRGFRKANLTAGTLENAYRTAGVELPQSLQESEVLAILRNAPGIAHIDRTILGLITGHVNNDNAADVAEEIISTYGRAVAVERIQARLTEYTKAADAARLDATVGRAYRDLGSFYKRRLKDLQKAAEGLPAGAETNIEVITAVGAGKAYMDAQGALEDLAAYYPVAATSGLGSLYTALSELAVFMRFDELGAQTVHPLTGRPVADEEPARTGIRTLHRLARESGFTAALLRAAAGRVTGVTISLSDGPDTTRARAMHAMDAVSTVAGSR